MYFHYMNSWRDTLSFQKAQETLLLEIKNSSAIMESFVGLGLYTFSNREGRTAVFRRENSKKVVYERENIMSSIGNILYNFGFNNE